MTVSCRGAFAVCSCDVGFTCSQCAGTPFDPAYFEDEPAPIRVDEFVSMMRPGLEQVWLTGGEGDL